MYLNESVVIFCFLAPKPSNWPQKGIIQFKNVSLRYNTQGQCVIQNLNLLINSGQKVSQEIIFTQRE